MYLRSGIAMKLMSHVPRTSENELRLNSYKLFQKSYAPWSLKCQKAYDTRSVAKKAEVFKDSNHILYVQYAITLSLYISILGFVVLSTYLWSLHQCIKITYGVVIYVIELGLYIALIIIYSTIIGNYRTADFDFIKFAVDNQCSAGPL